VVVCVVIACAVVGYAVVGIKRVSAKNFRLAKQVCHFLSPAWVSDLSHAPKLTDFDTRFWLATCRFM
jgi:hypothetical protein